MENRQLSMFNSVQDQAIDAAATGGVVKEARDPRESSAQVAGLGGSILWNIIDAANVMGALRKPGTDTDVMARVPTPIEGRLAEGKGSLLATKDYYAKKMLSKERYEDFKSRGFSAGNPDEDAVLKKAREAEGMVDSSITEEMLRLTRGEDAITVRENRVKNGRVQIDDLDFNFTKMNTSDDIKKVIQATTKIFKNEIDAASPSKSLRKTAEEAEELLANELGLTKKVLQKNRGLLDAAESTALRALLVKSAGRIDELSKKILGIGKNGGEIEKDVTTATYFMFRRQMALHAGLQLAAKTQQKNIAQALSSYRIEVGAVVGVHLQGDLMEQIIRSAGGKDETVLLAQGLQNAISEGGSAGVNRFVDKKLAYGNAAFEIYVNGLLSGPKTFFKNALGTPTFMMYLLAEDTVAAMLNSIERGGKKLFNKKLTPQDAEGIYLGQLAARVYGYIHAFRDAAANSAITIKTEASASAVGRVDTARFKAIDSEQLKISGWTGQAVDFFGRITRIPGLGLQATDDFWKGISQRAALYEQAYNTAAQAKFLGKSSKEAAEDGMEVLLDPQSFVKELDYAANYATLTTNTEGIGRIARAMQNFPERFPLGRLIIPFATVPTNVVSRALERSMAQIINPRCWGDLYGKRGPKARGKALAKVGVASSMFMYVTHLAATGRVTGALPRDKKERNMLPPGWQPFSLVFRGEGFPEDAPLYDSSGIPNGKLTYISYAGLEPVGLLFALGANYVELARRTTDLNTLTSIVGRYSIAMADYVEEMPMISGFGTISKAFQEQEFEVILRSPLANFIGPFPKPYSSLIRNIQGLDDATITRNEGKFDLWTADDVQKLAEETGTAPFYDSIGMKKAPDMRELYQRIVTVQVGNKEREAVQYDVLGLPKTKGVSFSTNWVLALWNMSTPFAISHGEEPDDLQKEIIRLRVPLVTSKNRVKGLPLTNIQQSEWAYYAKNTQIVKIGRTSSTFREALRDLIYSRSYERATYEKKRAAFKALETLFFDRAAQEFLFKEYPNLVDALEQIEYFSSQ